MAIIIKEANSKSDKKKFVQFQFDLYKDNKYWVPPIFNDEVKALMPEKNPAFEFCKAKFWLAFKDGKCAGRIAAIINAKHIEKTGQKLARFSRAEFINDYEVSAKLFEVAENWAKEQGMIGIQGPLGFANLDHQGMLVEGFDHLPSVASEYHLSYYKEHLEKLKYEKEIDWVEFRLTVAEIPEKAMRINDMIKQRYGLKVLSFTNKKELLPYAEKIFKVLNNAFEDLFSVIRFEDKMIQYYINRYFKILNPTFVKIIEDSNKEVQAFIIGLPSLSEAMQKAKGHLFPFGFYHLYKAMKYPKVIDLMLTGVEPNMQSKGLSAVLIAELQTELIKHGVKHAETTGIFEDNHKAIQHWKNYEHIQHKRKRCFKKIF